MIRIAICDDDRNVTAAIRQYLQTKAEQIPAKTLSVSLYHSGIDFLRDVENGGVFHIVFMDIQMDGLNGVEVGKIFREQPDNDSTILIYVSSHNSYAEALLDIGNIRFLKKPIDTRALDRIFNRVFEQTMRYKEVLNQQHSFYFNVNKETHAVKMHEIVYMKSSGKSIELHVWNKANDTICFMDKFYSSIHAAQEQLPTEQFVQCGRWYIVNLDYVQRFTTNSLTLTDAERTQIPVGNAFRESIKRAYLGRKKG